jgi:hypothetical protein
MIEFTCDCGKQLQAEDAERGRSVTCPECGKTLRVPDGAADRVTDARPVGRPDIAENERPRRPRFHDDERDLPREIVEKPKSHALLYTLIAVGVCLIVACPVLIVIGLFFPAVVKVRQAAERMSAMNNMMQIGLAMHNYEDANGSFPLAYSPINAPPGAPRRGMSWRVALMPYIEGKTPFAQYNALEPWDGPSNAQFRTMPFRVYQFPGDPPATTQSSFQVFVTVPGASPHSMFNHPTEAKNKVRTIDITDGWANTILIAESATAVPWPSPQDMPFDPAQPPPPLGSRLSGGAIIGLADGQARQLSPNINPMTLKALITRDGGEQISDPNW